MSPSGVNGTNGNSESLLEQVQLLQKTVQEIQSELSLVKDNQAVVALLNRYTALHDDACTDLKARQQWEDLFCADGEAIYPYGSHQGRKGMGSWAFGGVSYFEQCQLLSSNFHVTYREGQAERKEAHVRTNCIAQWLKKKDVFDDHFDEGGYYHWDLEKDDDGVWRVKRVHLTITWTTGEDPTGVGPKTVKN